MGWLIPMGNIGSKVSSNPAEMLRSLSSDRHSGISLSRGIVIEFSENGQALVGILPDGERQLNCDWLVIPDVGLSKIKIGDNVLVACPANVHEDGIVIGRIGRRRRGSDSVAVQSHVILEASESLILTCGESSVQLRKDGKVRVLGKDVLTRAKRTARIKGGSVAIN